MDSIRGRTTVSGGIPYGEYILEGHAASHVGHVRNNNEDNYVLLKAWNENAKDSHVADVCAAHFMGSWNCIGVFDGMGGGELGEVASRIAATEVLSAMNALGKNAACGQVDAAMRQAFLRANNAVVKLQQDNNVYGTTATVCCLDGYRFRNYHLGDSRAYLFRDNQLFLLTRDQTVAQMKIDAGFYDKDDPQIEREKHQLIEYIGCDRTMESMRPMESEWIDLKQGDRILLCSDGLYDMCTDKQIEKILQNTYGTDESAEALLREALDNGGKDNVTCVVIKITKKKNA